jgi:hypothetical protein
MSFTYDPTIADDISKVRSLIQDTVELTADFQDEELQFFLDINNGNIYKAAREAAFRLYVKYSKMADIEQVGKIRLEYVSRAGAMKDLYDVLLTETTKLSGKPMMYFGGITKAGFNKNRSDTSLVRPDFTKDSILFDPCVPDLPEDCTDII